MTTFQITMRQAAMASALLLFAGCGAMTSAPVLDDSARIGVNGAAQQSSTMPIDSPAAAEVPFVPGQRSIVATRPVLWRGEKASWSPTRSVPDSIRPAKMRRFSSR